MEEKVLNDAVICFPFKKNKVLLGIKKKHIGAGYWNGYGGGIEDGEKPEETAVRELKEETEGIIALIKDLEKIAIVDFHNTKENGETFVCKVHVYIAKKYTGKAKKTEEMGKPTWFDVDNLPFGKMMPTDKDWLKPALKGQKIIVKAYLGPYQKKKLKGTEIKPVDSFDE